MPAYLLEANLHFGITQTQQNANHADHNAKEQAQLDAGHKADDEAAHPAEEVLLAGLPQLLDGRQINLWKGKLSISISYTSSSHSP